MSWLVSEISIKLSRCPVNFDILLPRARVSQLLSEMEFIVSLFQTNIPDHGDDNDRVSLEWDDYDNSNYYSLYYNKSLSSVCSVVGDGDHNNVDDGDWDGDHNDVDGDWDGDHDNVEGDQDDDHEDVEGVFKGDHEDDEGVFEGDHEDGKGKDDHDNHMDEVKEYHEEDYEEDYEEDGKIAERVMQRKRTAKSSSTLVDKNDIELSQIDDATQSQANNFISSLLTFVSRVAPGNVFSVMKSARRRKRRVIINQTDPSRAQIHTKDLLWPYKNKKLILAKIFWIWIFRLKNTLDR